MGCGASRSPMQTGMSWPSFGPATTKVDCLPTKRSSIMKMWLALVCIMCAMLARPSASAAQADASSTRMLAVDGVQMRVWTAGIEQRKPGQPVVVLEAGAGADLETWKPIFPEVSRIGPVVAYDRRALGQSEADTASPTFTRTAQTLHAVLQALKVQPPYVLVGHS